MPLFLVGFVIGALLGARKARSLGGGRADMAQYAAGFGLALGLAGFILSVVLVRLGV
ncbi:MAG: hypothetical protein ACU0BS_02995 [Hasllibacter sp.]